MNFSDNNIETTSPSSTTDIITTTAATIITPHVKKRILVTGGAGLIGRPLCDHLMSLGHDVHVIDDLSNSTRDAVSPHWKSFHRIDLTDNRLTVETIGSIRPQIVYHLACHPYEGLSQFCPYDVCNTTHIATVNVLSGVIKCMSSHHHQGKTKKTNEENFGECENVEKCEKHVKKRHRVERFVNFSSMARYGSGHVMDNGHVRGPPFDETYRTNPEDVYAAAKVSAEKIVEILCDLHEIEWVHCVPHNVYGEGNLQVLSDPYRGVLLIWINCLLRGKPFYIYGDGEQTRAPSYVGDCLGAMALLGLSSNSELIASQTFNIGALKTYTLNDMARVMCQVYEQVTGKCAPEPLYTEARPLEVRHAYCNNMKSVRVLGYEDRTTLHEGLRRMVEWAVRVAPNGVAPRYLDELELDEKAPIQWREKLFL